MTKSELEDWIEENKIMADLDVAGLVSSGIPEYVILIDDFRKLFDQMKIRERLNEN